MGCREEDEKLLELLKTGATLEVACKAGRMDIAMVGQRLKEDKAFACEVAAAIGEAQIEFLKPLAEAARNGDWRAAAWWLERRGLGLAKEEPGKGKEDSGKREYLIEIRKVGTSARNKKAAKKKGKSETCGGEN